jgi:hypothetical protein
MTRRIEVWGLHRGHPKRLLQPEVPSSLHPGPLLPMTIWSAHGMVLERAPCYHTGTDVYLRYCGCLRDTRARCSRVQLPKRVGRLTPKLADKAYHTRLDSGVFWIIKLFTVLSRCTSGSCNTFRGIENLVYG